MVLYLPGLTTQSIFKKTPLDGDTGVKINPVKYTARYMHGAGEPIWVVCSKKLHKLVKKLIVSIQKKRG